MQVKLLYRWATLITICILLSGCGKFEVYVEIRPAHPTQAAALSITPAPDSATQPSPDLTPIGSPTGQAEASPTATTLSPVATSTPSNTASATSNPDVTPEPRRLRAGTPLNIISLHMLDVSQGWAVGQVDTDLNDRILFTNDGGQNWQDRTPYAALVEAPPEGLTAVTAFGSSQTAWVAYAALSPQSSHSQNFVWLTHNGGLTWQTGSLLDLSGIEQGFYQPGFLGFLPDQQHGWLLVHLGAGMSHDYIAIFTTADGGETWQRMVDPQNDAELMACVKSALVFSTDKIAWLAGDCPGLMPNLFLYRSTDGGHSWSLMSPPPPSGQPGDFFSGAQYACGISSWVYAAARDLMFLLRCDNSNRNITLSWLYSSHDSGLTWEANSIPVPFAEVSFRAKGEGWLLGSFRNDPSANQELYHSIDSGRSWTPVLPVGWQGKPEFVTSTKGWVAAQSRGDRALVRTTDGAKTWQVINPVIGP
jgi:photosystem II stability/assembly factor-like uncharacterized protein